MEERDPVRGWGTFLIRCHQNQDGKFVMISVRENSRGFHGDMTSGGQSGCKAGVGTEGLGYGEDSQLALSAPAWRVWMGEERMVTG